MRFLVHGSVAYDLLLTHDGSFLSGIDPLHLDRLSVNYLAQGYARHHGGTGANISWNLAALGHQPTLVSAVGFDGAEYLELLRGKGVDISHVHRIPEAITATAFIATDSSERQISFFHPGADALGTLPDMSSDRESLSFAIVSPRNPLLMIRAASQCAQWKIPYLFDPGQLVHAFGQTEFRTTVQGSRGLVTNEYEWGIAQEKLGWNEKEVIDACGLLVVTLGEKGIRLLTKDEDVLVPACKADRVINPTGAGDAARAGLLHGLSSGWSLLQTGRLAAVLGSFVVESEGTLLDSLHWDLLRERSFIEYQTDFISDKN